jgi:hypothetical protein
VSAGVLVPNIDLPPGPLTGEEAFERVREGILDGLRSADEVWRRARERLVAFAGYSNAFENIILDRSFADPATALGPTDPVYLALTTVAVAETDTGATITEANYTGYARKAIAAADMGAASGGSKSNTAQQQFANATAGSSTVIGWATADASGTGAGNVILFGTCTSTVISATQTPATIGVGVLVGTLD